MEQIELQRAIEAILFAAGERVELSRLAMALGADPADVQSAVEALADELAFNRRGIRILRLEDGYQQPHRHRRPQEGYAGDCGTLYEADHDPPLLREVRR